ncbi:MAG: CPBP family intramembrane metalloprotease [Cyanobacteria bacterium Co-bin8]|nr:CPBP family intramembrane metalloprotease [Cyanobacteria bacterium Co-bin8]
MSLRFCLPGRCFLKRWKFWGLLLGSTVATLLLLSLAASAISESNYSLARQSAFNRVEAYPIKTLPSTADYRPTGEWMGRLLLPKVEEYAESPGDWVWLEVWHAPIAEPNLVGQKVKLTWQPNPQTEAYVQAVTRDVQFTKQAEQSAEAGSIVPTRLNGRDAVGPLQSLAGARPEDDVTVRLDSVKLITEGTLVVLQTALEPIQVTGREYGLVKILGPNPEVKKPLPPECPGASPCPSEYFKVQHYSAATGLFDGTTETVRIPQQPQVGGHFFSSIRELENASGGTQGWYIYGARDAEGVFTVQALKPRVLFQLQPDQVVLGPTAGLNYIDRQNWQDTPARKGTLRRVLVNPTAAAPEAALKSWQEGDYALVIHLFGGIGGDNKESASLVTVTGHFAYGLARVIREPFTGELQFSILYQQIYAHNTNGIVAGTHDWSAFMGDLQRGWLGQRPVSDVVVKLDYFTQPLELGETTLSLFHQLLIEAQVIAARYRIGDGTGLAAVTPATSCVQDSSQALYIAMQQVKQQATANPATVEWIKQHPDDPEVQKFNQFRRLSKALTQALTPYGVVRSDWENNAGVLAGVAGHDRFARSHGLLSGILSWRSMMPRWGHDDISRIFLRQGAQLWFLRANQVGGIDLGIAPVAPTLLLGGVPVLGQVMKRLADAVAQPTWDEGSVILGSLLLYGAIALPYGFKSKFLRRFAVIGNPLIFLFNLVRLLLLPALIEEVLFRVILLPHPVEGLPLGRWLIWAGLSLGLFVVYHFFSARTYYPAGNPTFFDRRFVILMTWLGIVLTLAYGVTGSIWVVTLIHWVVVAVWLHGLGGISRLAGKKFSGEESSTRPNPV